MYTQLLDRKLWYDGHSSYHPSTALDMLRTRDVHFCDGMTPDIAEYNKLVSHDDEIRVKTGNAAIFTNWTIPDQYKHLDVISHVFTAHETSFRTHSDFNLREERLASELMLYVKHKLIDVLRAVIWVINSLTEADVVWGVGRGSSVSSYVLYVLGVHDVDSFSYQLDISDFLESK